MRKLLIGILLLHTCISYAQIISTNIENGNQYINRTDSSFGFVYAWYGRVGKTNQITLNAGQELVVHGVNVVPIDRNCSQAFIRKKLASGQYSTIGISTTNSSFSSSWKGPIIGPAIIEYGLDSVSASYSQSFSQFDWNATNDIGSFLKTYCDFLLEVKNSSLSEASSTSASISSTSVVVPSNATGDVDVLLEQSTDMITWTQCLPGTYNASTQKRFFRVRAVEK